MLGLETTRHWCRRSVLRVVPLMLGLFTAVALLWSRLPACRRRRRDSATPCYGKRAATFADVLFTVRRELWRQSLLTRHRGKQRCLDLLPRPLAKHSCGIWPPRRERQKCKSRGCVLVHSDGTKWDIRGINRREGRGRKRAGELVRVRRSFIGFM